MDVRSWRYFLAIAEAGSVAGAARKLRVAQPALSRQLTALEAEMRTPLVVRHRRGITLTDAGVVLSDRTRSLLREIENVRDEVSAKATEPSGRLSIGIPPSLSNAITVPLVQSYCALHPKVELVVREGPTEDLAAELAAGRLDATLATMGEPTRHFECQIVAHDHLALVAPPGVRLPGDGVGIDVLLGKRLIVMSNAGFMLDRLVRAAAQVGGCLDFGLSVNSMTCLRLVEAGVGYSIVPMIALKTPPWRHLSASRIRGLPMQWALCTLRDRPTSSAFAAMRRILLSVIGDIAD
jgi:LysR family nitrogen assimilation transcriptional regulator